MSDLQFFSPSDEDHYSVGTNLNGLSFSPPPLLLCSTTAFLSSTVFRGGEEEAGEPEDWRRAYQGQSPGGRPGPPGPHSRILRSFHPWTHRVSKQPDRPACLGHAPGRSRTFLISFSLPPSLFPRLNLSLPLSPPRSLFPSLPSCSPSVDPCTVHAFR